MNRHQKMSSLSSGGSKGHQVYGWDKKQIKPVYDRTVSEDKTTSTWGVWHGVHDLKFRAILSQNLVLKQHRLSLKFSAPRYLKLHPKQPSLSLTPRPNQTNGHLVPALYQKLIEGSVSAWLLFLFKLAGHKLSHLIRWRDNPCAQSHHNIRYNWQAQIRACNFCDLTAVRYTGLQLYLSQHHKKDRWDT